MPSAALLDQCSAQGDPRQAWKVVHPLPDVLLVVLCGTPAGGQTIPAASPSASPPGPVASAW